MFERPIAISLSPNTEKDDVFLSVKILLQPWIWFKGKAVSELETLFQKNYPGFSALSFSSGRAALFSILKSFSIGSGDEVIIQPFTCIAVPNAVLWTGATPVYVDIDDTLNINPALLEKSISKKTKAIIVQHTFGIPAKLRLIKKITQKYKLLLIEDCAHSLGATYDGKPVGSWGDAAVFSYGRDKVLSSVFGGIGIIRNDHGIPLKHFRKIQNNYKIPGGYWIFQQLLHPLLFSIILPLYRYCLGKLMLVGFQKFNLLSFPVYPNEKRGMMEKTIIGKLPNALALMALCQLSKLSRYNEKRRLHAAYYYNHLRKDKIKLPVNVKGSIFMRFNVFSENSENIIRGARKEGIVLGNWYKNIIDPKDVLPETVYYRSGNYINAEKAASLSVNLPTYPGINLKDLKKVTDFINHYGN